MKLMLVLFPLMCVNVVIVALKVASYALTNRDLRDMYLESIPTPEQYASAPYPTHLTYRISCISGGHQH